MSTPALTISDWKPRVSGTLRGFCTAQLPSGMFLHETAIHTRNGIWWASPASKPMVGKDGTVLRDEAGKIRYSPIVSFASRERRDRFSQGVIEALRQVQPEVFAAESEFAS
jgi:hypothetical protein